MESKSITVHRLSLLEIVTSKKTKRPHNISDELVFPKVSQPECSQLPRSNGQLIESKETKGTCYKILDI